MARKVHLCVRLTAERCLPLDFCTDLEVEPGRDVGVSGADAVLAHL